MKIRRIEYENFRNFKEPGYIDFSTDGKATIIYGKNGDGKTTLHQLFQWIIYGKVKFNKTATEHMYNLSLQKEKPFGSKFEVKGRIDFEQDGYLYSITRKYTYKKELKDSTLIGEEISLQKRDEDFNWKPVEHATEMMERFLPSGLSEYFFFDGESMIADLRVKGKESANKLRKALYSMFDLDVIKSAIGHIGSKDTKTTAIGKLYLSQDAGANSSEMNKCKLNIENAQGKLTKINAEIDEKTLERENNINIINEISEQIGSTKSKAEYEHQRTTIKKQQVVFENNAKYQKELFGKMISVDYAPLLISKTIIDAQKQLNMKVNSVKLPSGLNTKLIDYLTGELTETCICGEPLTARHKEHIKSYLKLLPPRSYASMYHEFTKSAQLLKEEYDPNKLDQVIKSIIDNLDLVIKCDKDIKELDEAEKNSKDIEDLIVSRAKAEERNKEIDQELEQLRNQKLKFDIFLKQQMDKFDKLRGATSENELIERKMNILSQASSLFNERLQNATTRYSEELQSNIQSLLDKMLTSKRNVSVSNEFSVRVTDSFNDESKSEGQFAVVSFAYIGGILQMLKKGKDIYQKEYPLVLDGPFSKLDPDQRQNVVNMLPEFAPQVIIFSKDDLTDVFDEDKVGKIWTIKSNDEKNIAEVKEGMLWK